MFSLEQRRLASRLLRGCRGQGIRLVGAESCTGGLVAACLTSVAGSSDVVERGFVTYSNQAKIDLLGVPESLLAAHGAVSAPVAEAMAEGALACSPADLSVALTGIAGPGGGTAEKPVGLVYIACSRRNHGTVVERHRFGGSRDQVRSRALEAALRLGLQRL